MLSHCNHVTNPRDHAISTPTPMVRPRLIPDSRACVKYSIQRPPLFILTQRAQRFDRLHQYVHPRIHETGLTIQSRINARDPRYEHDAVLPFGTKRPLDWLRNKSKKTGDSLLQSDRGVSCNGNSLGWRSEHLSWIKHTHW